MTARHPYAAEDMAPLPPVIFHILLSLGMGERHGYALKREISLRTGGSSSLARARFTDPSTKCWNWG